MVKKVMSKSKLAKKRSLPVKVQKKKKTALPKATGKKQSRPMADSSAASSGKRGGSDRIRELPKHSAVPTRLPLKKIIGPDGVRAVVTSHSVIASAEPKHTSESVDDAKSLPVPPRLAIVRPAPGPEVTEEKRPMPKLPWSKIPDTFPVATRFVTSMAEKECRAAASWPFPFARFLATLPDQLCGRGFALLLMCLEHEIKVVAQRAGVEPAEVERTVAREESNLIQMFAASCPEMYRKMSTQLGGVGVSIDTLIERYLVAKVDRAFQLTVGAVILRALRV